MRSNRLYAFAAAALLLVGASGTVAARSFAQPATAPVAQSVTASVTQPANCANDTQDESASVGADTDNVDLQCGDQNAPDTAEAMDVEEAQSADGQDAAPSGTPAITADQAQAAALTAHPGTVVQTELDDENGSLVYSVEFAGGVDVKVDAMTGAVLGTDSGQD